MIVAAMLPEFTVTHVVQFSETDMAGIVHFSNYFRWMERVEHAFFRSVGLSVSMAHDGRHLGWPRVSAACDYLGPVRFEDEVSLTLRVTKVGGRSFSYEVDFTVVGRPVALGKLTSVCCVLTEGKMKSIEIPADVRAKLTGSPARTTVA
ncbi:MAG: 4-hydroxybenzoyl-CoA thioesterase [Phycisphaerales bacterium]|nr:4-hydroxybenzoyl-CoA thioesterase [Phycisphaerales bacterium]